jgi:hypothetical protein
MIQCGGAKIGKHLGVLPVENECDSIHVGVATTACGFVDGVAHQDCHAGLCLGPHKDDAVRGFCRRQQDLAPGRRRSFALGAKRPWYLMV